MRKTDDEIKDYFCELMYPFSKNDIQVITNTNIRGSFKIPHDAYDLKIFELMKEFVNAEAMDIISNRDKLYIEWIY